MRKIGLVITVLVSAFSTTSLIVGGDDIRRPMDLLGHVRLSAIYSVKARPPYAYALEAGLLNVLDISNPEHVRVISEVPVKLPRQRVEIYRNWLFLYGFANPLALLDIYQPDKPRWVAEFPEFGGILSSGMEIEGETLFAVSIPGKQSLWTGAPASLQIIDIHDPRHPARLGTIDLDVALHQVEGVNVAAAGNRLYLLVRNAAQASSRSELVRVNVKDRQHPFIERRDLLPRGKNFKTIRVLGDTAYVLEMAPQHGLAILRLHEDAPPTLTGEITDQSLWWGIDLTTAGSYVYATFKGAGANLVAFDVSQPAQPRIADKYVIEGFGATGLGTDLVGDRLYVAGDFAPMPIFDVSRGLPRILGRWNYEGGSAEDLTVIGSTLYIANFGGGLVAYDVRRPSAARLKWRYDRVKRTEPFQDLTLPRAWEKEVLLGFSSRAAELLDVSGQKPKIIASYQPVGEVSALSVSGEYAYFGLSTSSSDTGAKKGPSEGSIEVVRRQGADLRLIASAKVATGVADMAATTGRLITLTNAGDILDFDARDPASLRQIGQLGLGESGYSSRLAVAEDHAFVLVQTQVGANLFVIDLSGKNIRVVCQSHFKDKGYRATLAVGSGYMALYAGQLRVYDISSPSAPVLLAEQQLESLGEPTSLAVHSGRLYVSDAESGVWIYALPSLGS